MKCLSKEDLLARQKEAYVSYKGGTSVTELATKFGISERMVYRDIDAFELMQLRKWRKTIDEALKVTSVNAPVSTLLKVINAKK